MTTADLVALLERARNGLRPIHYNGELGADIDTALTLLRSGSLALVPGEPTEEMCKAALEEWDKRNYYATRGYVDEGDADLCYRAMLEAAKGKP